MRFSRPLKQLPWPFPSRRRSARRTGRRQAITITRSAEMLETRTLLSATILRGNYNDDGDTALVDQWLAEYSIDWETDTLQYLLGASSVETTDLIDRAYIVGFDNPLSRNAGVRLFDTLPGIESVYPLVAEQFSSRLIPNDALFGQQWHLRNTGQSGLGHHRRSHRPVCRIQAAEYLGRRHISSLGAGVQRRGRIQCVEQRHHIRCGGCRHSCDKRRSVTLRRHITGCQ